MARPTKSGLDYFPLDVTLDEKIELVEAKHGLLGFGLVIKLFQNIYRNGYYVEATEERLLLLKKRFVVEYDFIVDVINSACKWKLFNEKLFDEYRILTSYGIQKRFIEATKRRKEVDFIKEYLLIKNPKSYYTDSVNVYINSLNVIINPKNDDSGTQSKVKYSIVKKYYCKFPLKDGTEYQVTPDQIKTFLTAYPDVDLESEFLKITAWCKTNDEKLKTRRGSPRFLNNWISREQEKAAINKQPTTQSILDNQPPIEDLLS